MNRVVINGMCGTENADTERAKGRRESSCAGGLVVDDTGHEVVSNDMTRTAAEVDTVSTERRNVAVTDAVDPVQFDSERTDRAVRADVDALVSRWRKTFDPNRIPGNQPVSRSLSRDADGIDLIGSTSRWVTDLITCNL